MIIEIDVRDLDCNIVDLPGDIIQMNLQTRNSKRFQIEIPLEVLLKSKTIKKYIEEEKEQEFIRVWNIYEKRLEILSSELEEEQKASLKNCVEVKLF